MVKNYFAILLFIFLFSSMQISAQERMLWTQTDLNIVENLNSETAISIKDSRAYHLELSEFKNQLSQVTESKNALRNQQVKIKFPLQNGELVSFWVRESAVMHPGLAIKFPNNKSYTGIGIDHPEMRVNFSLNELGLHAMVISKSGEIQYIDPLIKNIKEAKDEYQVYNRADNKSEGQGFQCVVDQFSNQLQKGAASTLKSYDKKLRTYRLALAANFEYSQYHVQRVEGEDLSEQEQKAIVLASLTIAITRINYLFENDLAVRLELVENNDDIIFIEENDPYTGDESSDMLQQNQTTCDRYIGESNYDVGHVLGGLENSGVAHRAKICDVDEKAYGVTRGKHPTGDSFYYDFFAHELGHQFGANHTFNGYTGSCQGNRNDNTAVEPGSGSTIMAYAGQCLQQDVQTHSDLYFHSVSIEEIWSHIASSGGSCAITTDLVDNLHIPVADAGTDFTIPKGTAFKLVGDGIDEDGDLLSYCWEQIDNQINRVPPSENDRIGTLYRSYPPSLNNVRYLPDLKDLRNGALSSTWEVTPTVARDLNFSLTVRDNNPEAGQTNIDKLKVTVADAAGPFVVTSQITSGIIWDQNSDQLVEWDVAGTDSNGVDVSKVNILLSTDGGLSFPTVLLANTENDGVETIKVPYYTAGSCYLMVEAVDHFFFALNQRAFSIGEDNRFCDDFSSTDVPLMISDNDIKGVFSIIDIKEDLKIDYIRIAVDIEHSSVKDLSLELESPEGTIIILLNEACDFYDNDIQAVFLDTGDGIECNNSAPVIRGEIRPVELLNAFAGENTIGEWKLKVIDTYDGDIGRLVSWSMSICSYDEVLSAKEQNLKGFNVYPNPTDGSFEVSFTLKPGDVTLQLFDILGRRVMQKFYQSNSLEFKQSIETIGFNKGIYFLKVSNGGHFSTKKVIIK
jgi:subtilisin-like proprotein convertase family protein